MIRILRITCLLAIALLAGARFAHAASVWIEPADTTITLHDSLAVRVHVSDVADLKAFRLRFGYTPTVVSVLGALDGEVLTGASSSYVSFLLGDREAPADTTEFDAAMLDDHTQGPGILVYFVFHGDATGIANLVCAGLDLRDSENGTIPVDCTGAILRVTAPVPVATRTWGALKSAYR